MDKYPELMRNRNPFKRPTPKDIEDVQKIKKDLESKVIDDAQHNVPERNDGKLDMERIASSPMHQHVSFLASIGAGALLEKMSGAESYADVLMRIDHVTLAEVLKIIIGRTEGRAAREMFTMHQKNDDHFGRVVNEMKTETVACLGSDIHNAANAHLATAFAMHSGEKAYTLIRNIPKMNTGIANEALSAHDIATDKNAFSGLVDIIDKSSGVDVTALDSTKLAHLLNESLEKTSEVKSVLARHVRPHEVLDKMKSIRALNLGVEDAAWVTWCKVRGTTLSSGVTAEVAHDMHTLPCASDPQGYDMYRLLQEYNNEDVMSELVKSTASKGYQSKDIRMLQGNNRDAFVKAGLTIGENGKRLWSDKMIQDIERDMKEETPTLVKDHNAGKILSDKGNRIVAYVMGAEHAFDDFRKKWDAFSESAYAEVAEDTKDHLRYVLVAKKIVNSLTLQMPPAAQALYDQVQSNMEALDFKDAFSFTMALIMRRKEKEDVATGQKLVFLSDLNARALVQKYLALMGCDSWVAGAYHHAGSQSLFTTLHKDQTRVSLLAKDKSTYNNLLAATNTRFRQAFIAGVPKEYEKALLVIFCLNNKLEVVTAEESLQIQQRINQTEERWNALVENAKDGNISSASTGTLKGTAFQFGVLADSNTTEAANVRKAPAKRQGGTRHVPKKGAHPKENDRGEQVQGAHHPKAPARNLPETPPAKDKPQEMPGKDASQREYTIDTRTLSFSEGITAYIVNKKSWKGPSEWESKIVPNLCKAKPDEFPMWINRMSDPSIEDAIKKVKKETETYNKELTAIQLGVETPSAVHVTSAVGHIHAYKQALARTEVALKALHDKSTELSKDCQAQPLTNTFIAFRKSVQDETEKQKNRNTKDKPLWETLEKRGCSFVLKISTTITEKMDNLLRLFNHEEPERRSVTKKDDELLKKHLPIAEAHLSNIRAVYRDVDVLAALMDALFMEVPKETQTPTDVSKVLSKDHTEASDRAAMSETDHGKAHVEPMDKDPVEKGDQARDSAWKEKQIEAQRMGYTGWCEKIDSNYLSPSAMGGFAKRQVGFGVDQAPDSWMEWAKKKLWGPSTTPVDSDKTAAETGDRDDAETGDRDPAETREGEDNLDDCDIGNEEQKLLDKMGKSRAWKDSCDSQAKKDVKNLPENLNKIICMHSVLTKWVLEFQSTSSLKSAGRWATNLFNRTSA